MSDSRPTPACRHCGTDIEFCDERWRAITSRYPNDAHCHYSAVNGKSVGHEPEDEE